LPPWAKRFAASCVCYIAEEKTALAEILAAAAVAAAAEARAEAAAAAETAAAEAAAAASDADAKGEKDDTTASKAAKALALKLFQPPPQPQTEEEALEEAAAAKVEAEAEAAGVAAGRVQSLAVTLDKVRHVLSVQLGCDASGDGNNDARIAAAPPPLVALAPTEALQLLNDTVARVVKAAEAVLSPAATARVREAAPIATAAAASGGDNSIDVADARASLRSLAAALWREGSAGQHDDNDDSDADAALAAAQAASSAGDLCHLTAETKTFFKALPGAAFTSPYVQVGSTGGGAGVVHQMQYGALATWAFLATWHSEYLEAAEDCLARDCKGAVQLPSPAGPLEFCSKERANRNGNGNSSSSAGAGSSRRHAAAPKPIGAQPPAFLMQEMVRLALYTSFRNLHNTN
jgi:hypothetical protein